LMVINKARQTITHQSFFNLIDYLHAGDVLVLNNTKVIPARIFGYKDTGAKIEVMLLKKEKQDLWEALVKPGKRVQIGTEIVFHEGKLRCQCVGIDLKSGTRKLLFTHEGIFEQILDEVGVMPLPPYITQKLEKQERYQTVYAKEKGSAAAPTAGLHFTEELMARLRAKGVEICEVLLHVGLGTFRPVQVQHLEDHDMHSEYYEVSPEAADILSRANKEGRRIVAVGTTSVRTLESLMQEKKSFIPHCGHTEIFIYPGYQFQAVDAIITNFHLPKSTLIMLVSAFMGTSLTKRAYQVAVEEHYRFFSFGDAMLIE